MRELLMNVVKHASASKAIVSIRIGGGEVELSVSDDGCGFEVDAATQSGHSGFGLFSIRDRLPHLGGKLTICSKQGRGTTATITMPLNNSKRTA